MSSMNAIFVLHINNDRFQDYALYITMDCFQTHLSPYYRHVDKSLLHIRVVRSYKKIEVIGVNFLSSTKMRESFWPQFRS